MKIDNFTTARCSKCGWIKQFQPGVEIEPIEFQCECGKEAPEAIKPKPKKRSIVKEVLSGTPSKDTTEENIEG